MNGTRPQTKLVKLEPNAGIVTQLFRVFVCAVASTADVSPIPGERSPFVFVFAANDQGEIRDCGAVLFSVN